MKIIAAILLMFGGAGIFAAQVATTGQNVLLRRYREGEKLTYHMKGVNENWHYEIQADGAVKKDASGTYFEEYSWSNMISDGAKVSLPVGSANFRQELTLDPNHPPSFPNLSQVDTRLVGPMTDLMTFYVDLWLVVKTGQLNKPGDHFYFKRGAPNSWADGSYVLIGEDSIDFDFTLKDVNQTSQTATILIRHVPPEKPEIKLPAEWMHNPAADTPNNWIEVKKTGEGKYVAAVGKETFDVEIKLSLADGRILSGTIDNPVESVERICEDAALTKCGDARRHPIRRQIQIVLEHR
jgi:hypothetical protein